jgi:hypothetical protein
MDIFPVQGVMLHQYTSSVHSSAFYVFHQTHFLSLQAVYLHVLADTLGSAGVIISSICVEYRGWVIADPICSLCIGSVIFTSVLPLVAVSAQFHSLPSIPPPMSLLLALSQTLMCYQGDHVPDFAQTLLILVPRIDFILDNRRQGAHSSSALLPSWQIPSP